MLSLALAMLTYQATPLPSKNQLDWHKRQYYAFVHFGPNTFTGEEWGHGTEDPDVFNPAQLDCRQWCRAFKDAGMSGVIITAKHHDGFALWQSKQTQHGVMSSKWRGGQGDVLKELSEACKEYGLWMGVYLSPWDRNHPTYGTPQYNDTFVAMLQEVLTNYGDIKEVWFDGANGEGPNGKKQVYDWPRFEATVRKYAPNAVIFGDGGDVRWVGNEQGFVGETNWNFLPSGHWPGDTTIYHLLNEGDPNGDKYSPGECDVSIRPGWFWRASEDSKVKSLEQLQEIWYRSVGHGGNLLLNVPPNDKGQISQPDIEALNEFKRWREATFGRDLASGAKPERVKDDLYRVQFKEPTLIDHIVLREDLRKGQRITKFSVTYFPSERSALENGPSGTTVGSGRTLRFPPMVVYSMSVRVESRTGAAAIASIGAFLGPPSVAIYGEGAFVGSTNIALDSDNPHATIYYTTDGAEPGTRSSKYDGPFTIAKSCTLKAIAIYQGQTSVSPAEARFTRYTSQDLWPATVFIRQPDPGLRYSYFARRLQTLDQLKDAKADETGVSVNGLDLAVRQRDEDFALAFDGVLSVPEDGVYTFTLASDDGSRLSIDEHVVADNDGLHGVAYKQGVAPLKAGYHRVRIEYFNASGGMGLKLEWSGPGVKSGAVPAEAFRH